MLILEVDVVVMYVDWCVDGFLQSSICGAGDTTAYTRASDLLDDVVIVA